jgi:hypothetical protein
MSLHPILTVGHRNHPPETFINLLVRCDEWEPAR